MRPKRLRGFDSASSLRFLMVPDALNVVSSYSSGRRYEANAEVSCLFLGASIQGW
jgi:hypothetical protein